MTLADWITVAVLTALVVAVCWLDAEVKHRRRVRQARRNTPPRLPGVPE
jgi:hypothetical protein